MLQQVVIISIKFHVKVVKVRLNLTETNVKNVCVVLAFFRRNALRDLVLFLTYFFNKFLSSCFRKNFIVDLRIIVKLPSIHADIVHRVEYENVSLLVCP